MNTILQKRIEEAARELVEIEVDKRNYNNENYSVSERIRSTLFDGYEVIDILCQFAEQMLSHQWISVDEELPPQLEGEYVSKYVFVTNGGWSGVMRYEFNKKVWLDYGNYSHYGITHWMKIPPLEGGEE